MNKDLYRFREEVMYIYGEEYFRVNSKCDIFEISVFLVCLRSSKEICEFGVERMRGRVVGDVVRGIMRR